VLKGEELVDRLGEVRDAVQLHEEQLRVCGACDASLIASFSHGTCCRKSCTFVKRHNRVRDLLAALLRKHMRAVPESSAERAQVVVEQHVSFGERGDAVAAAEGGVDMDVVVRLGAKTFWIDVSVTNPGGRHNMSSGNLSAVYPLNSAKLREKAKRYALKQRWPLLDEAGPALTFVPFVMEATGALGPCALAFLQESGIHGDAIRRFLNQACVTVARYGGIMMDEVFTRSVKFFRPFRRAAPMSPAGAEAPAGRAGRSAGEGRGTAAAAVGGGGRRVMGGSCPPPRAGSPCSPLSSNFGSEEVGVADVHGVEEEREREGDGERRWYVSSSFECYR
jgi:hypothetical protein